VIKIIGLPPARVFGVAGSNWPTIIQSL